MHKTSTRRRALGCGVLVGIAVLAVSACVPLPPQIVYETVPPSVAPPVAPTTAPPLPVPSAPPTQEPAPEPEPSEEPEPVESLAADGTPVTPSAPIGATYGGNDTANASGLTPDTPAGVVIPPSYGDPDVQAGSPWGNASAGDTFRADEDPAPVDDLLLSTTGRLYITFPNGELWNCSATVINSATDNVAITAAHCMYNTFTGELATEVQFVPGDADQASQAPFGVWTAEEWWMPQVFIDTAQTIDNATHGDGWAWDYAYLRFPPAADGNEIEDFTGGQGISFRAEANGALVLGYPHLPPFDGMELRFCSANALGFGEMYWPHFTAGCRMTVGMSGGPWITDVDDVTGAGYIVGVSSTINGNTASSAPLGESALELLHDIEE